MKNSIERAEGSSQRTQAKRERKREREETQW